MLAARMMMASAGRSALAFSGDATTGGTASASEQFDGTTTAAKAIDDDTGTYWASLTSATAWWQVQLATPRAANRLTITGRTSFYDRAPTGWVLYGSNTGAFGGEETTIYTATEGGDGTYTSPKTYAFTNNTEFEYYRIAMDDKSGAFGQASEFQIAEIELTRV